MGEFAQQELEFLNKHVELGADIEAEWLLKTEYFDDGVFCFIPPSVAVELGLGEGRGGAGEDTDEGGGGDVGGGGGLALDLVEVGQKLSQRFNFFKVLHK